ncbi:hypothetical protein BT96DRAFT_1003562 [Gymnopus androsaceus JB14]|uniref:Uncharacterized protein n=1 Tax=Gymnopus androsaceus JB14 TaxID=1447944 RepID=A0A6A4GVQ3_9AGAR|nr:hypothetical protein BT96DRAFT_1003562 [Gymnopus androsaceus JB14]
MNASAFAPYAESISTLSSSHCCITAFSPSSAAPVPPVITMDTNSGATQFILRTLYNEEENLVILNPTFPEVVPRHVDHLGLATEETKTTFTEGPSGNLSPDDGDGEGPADPVLPVVLLLEELLTQNLWNPLHNKPSHFSKALKDL